VCLLLCLEWGGPELPFAPVAAALAVANGLILWRISEGVWDRDRRAWRLVIGLVVCLVLSCVYALLAAWVYIFIHCSHVACFS
jgi:hypothetical protein